MVTRVKSDSDFYVPTESDITGADATNDGTSSGNASSTVVLPVGFFNSSLPTITSGNAGALQIDSSGRLIIAPIPTGSNVIGGVTQSGSWDVDIASLPANRIFSADLTLDTSAYAVGDVLADQLTITNAVLSSAGTGRILAVTVIDIDDQGQPFDIIVFNQTTTVGTKNAAWAVSDAAMLNALGIIKIESADYTDLGSNRIATVQGLSIGIQPSSGTSIFIGTISRGTGTYTAAGLRLVFTIERDG
jgi:hypothetical protein